ncbi:phosphoethanolamine transferase EptA [Parasalinivibrio latis]|uniref:phosphoethanolamine transferase EptA n=1 Tax=Parasalinivibrio latis TaxID=2952610 RepID=UPI0030E11CB5
MKRRISQLNFTLIVALFFATIQNAGLWKHLFDILSQSQPIDWGFVASIPVFITVLCFTLFTLLVWPVVYKVIVPVLIALSTLATYAMVTYGQYFNYDMIVNIFETNQSEATSYLSVSLALWVLGLIILPVIAVLTVKVEFPKSLPKLLLQKVIAIVAALVVAGGVAALYYKDYASLVRNHSEIKSLINPTNYLSASFRYAKYSLYEKNLPFKSLGTDAKDNNHGTKPNVVVLVVGETSRGMNYSLNGYNRDTNPRLSKENVISFQKVTSCGTATAVSVPCMFSVLSHDNYNAITAKHQEGLLDVLKHAGIDVSWKDNDGGCKGVCDRVEHVTIDPSKYPQQCEDGTCYDSVLLEGLKEKVHNAKRDTVIVLHLIGSHGPTYYKRYPKEFQVFKPTCDTAEIQDCTQQALVNTYDNTVVYTDYILSRVIGVLKDNDIQHNTALLYLSDHGESLGESGIYLHGLPYDIAPVEQKTVPLIMWMSPSYMEHHKINRQCIVKNAKNVEYSQDNLFHTLLGMMSVTTQVYQPGMDILAGCENSNPSMPQ